MSCLCEPQASGRRNRRRNSGSGAAEDDFDKVSIEANADDSESKSPEPDPDLQADNEPEDAEPAEFGHLNETRRKIRDAIAALNDDDAFDKRMARLLAQFEG